MRVLFEAENYNKPGGTGIKTYAENLARGVRELGYESEALLSAARRLNKKDPLLAEIDFFDSRRNPAMSEKYLWTPARFAFGSPFGLPTMPLPRTGAVIRPDDARSAEAPVFDRVRLSYRFAEAARFHMRRHGRLARLRLDERPDIFHATQVVPLHVPGALNVYTIHDIVPLRLPYATLDNKKVFLQTVREICRRADHIVTVSEHARRDILSVVDMPESRITNTYQTVRIPERLASQPEDDVARLVENVFGLEHKNYYLFIGVLEPKKNVTRLIDAYAASGVSAPLVIAGGLGWGYDDATARIEQEHFGSYRIADHRVMRERRIRRFEYLAFPNLVALIRGAKALLFPSLYEGFGIPVLESMLLGTPVMTSTSSSLPEVAGDAAILVDPYDVAAMATAIRTLDNDADLRADLVERGRVQAQKFSPEAYGERIKALYKSITG